VREGWSFKGSGDWPGFDDGFAAHAPVGSFAPNAFGLHDVHGNVWEWCRDGRHAFEPGPQRDPFTPVAEDRQPINRGGSFIDAARAARSARRSYDSPRFSCSYLGWRPARELEP
jgi:formylglycine-generating enzyme required for sulfatase activity